jgi:hypothetical protein
MTQNKKTAKEIDPAVQTLGKRLNIKLPLVDPVWFDVSAIPVEELEMIYLEHLYNACF